MSSFATETVIRKLSGEQVSRPRALAVTVVAAVGAGVLVYRLLRSGDGQPPDEDSD